jgi:methionyl-tRNA synthetase
VKDIIDFNDFAKLDLRVGEVVEVLEVEGSEKLLELHVEFGEEIGQRTIYAGIKAWYAPSDLTGRKLIFVVNLAPKKFKIGKKEHVSEGMLMAAAPGAVEASSAVLYSFDEDLPVGTILR